jgi:MFS family permease
MTSSLTEAPAAKHKTGFFINRDFALLLVGQTISSLGDVIFDFTLLIWLAVDLLRGIAWAPLAISGLVIAEFTPMLLVRPFTGVFVDRWNRQRIMLTTDIVRALLVGLTLFTAGIIPIPHVTLSFDFRLGSLYTVVFLLNGFGQFFNPARRAILSEVVAEPLRTRAAGMEGALVNMTRLIGPPLAAPLLFTLGVQWGLIANALSYVVSFVAVSTMRRRFTAPPTAQQHFGRELLAGWRFTLHSSFFRALLGLTLLMALALGPLNSLIVFFVAANLHTSAANTGYLVASLSVGALFGSIIAAWLAQRIGFVRFTAGATILLGIGVIAFSRATDLPRGTITLALCGVCIGMATVPQNPMIMHETPRTMMGRVLSLIGPMNTIGTLISVASFGALAAALAGFHYSLFGIIFGQYDSIIALSGVLFILAGIFAAATLRLSPQSVEDQADHEQSAAQALPSP